MIHVLLPKRRPLPRDLRPNGARASHPAHTQRARGAQEESTALPQLTYSALF